MQHCLPKKLNESNIDNQVMFPQFDVRNEGSVRVNSVVKDWHLKQIYSPLQRNEELKKIAFVCSKYWVLRPDSSVMKGKYRSLEGGIRLLNPILSCS